MIIENEVSNKLDISVVIPTFNREKLIYSTLLALLAQKLTKDINYEIVIIDSGDDNTGELIASLDTKMPNILKYKKIPLEKNRSKLRNLGAKHANGDIIVFIDNDMLVPPDYLQKHYDLHDKDNNIIILGKRFSLTTFEINNIGWDVLIYQFELIKKMQYYEDPRDTQLKKHNQTFEESSCLWRFLYSHNFSIKKDFFTMVGGFNIDFGNHWGYEDLELGFRLTQAGAKYYLEENMIAYHQPHFEQSKIDQSITIHNKSLFLSLHPCYEVELIVNFNDSFSILYDQLEMVKRNHFDRKQLNLKNSDTLVLGCLYNRIELKKGQIPEKQYLGTFLPHITNHSVERCKILSTLFYMPENMILSILSEAFRITKTVEIEFEEIMEDAENLINSHCLKIGINAIIESSDGCLTVNMVNRLPIKIFSINLPDIFSPAKRFFYLKLAEKLRNLESVVIISDIKECEHISGEDFSLDDSEVLSLNKLYEKAYGSCPVRSISSIGIVAILSERSSMNFKENIVIQDNDYISTSKIAEYYLNNFCTHIDKIIYQQLMFSFLMDYLEVNKLNCSCNPNSFLMVCENGYEEDGLDLALDAFSLAIKENPSLYITIKIPNFEESMEKNFPLHNKSSKKAKNYGSQIKIERDLYKLQKKIIDKKLEKYVTIIHQSQSIRELSQMVKYSKGIISTCRGYNPPISVLLGILHNNVVLLPSHVILLENLEPYVERINSEEAMFGQIFDIPITSNNISYRAGQIYLESLCNILSSQKKVNKNKLKIATINKIYEEAKERIISF